MSKTFMHLGFAISTLLAVPAAVNVAAAQDFPSRPVHLVVGYGAGGGTDLVARAIAKQLAIELGQSVVVENKPGAGGSIGASYVARAKPDGYTLLISSASSVIISPAINPKLDYTLRDFTPIAQISSAPLLLAVNKDLGINSVQELIQYAKAKPGSLNFASSGLGSGPHLAGVLFQQVAGVDMSHVPYKSGAPAVMSVVSGDTQLTFATTPTVVQLVRSKEVTGLAVTTRDPSPLVPELGGMQQAGLPAYEIFQWNGVFAPANTPAPIVEKLFKAVRAAMSSDEVKKILKSSGTDVYVSQSPADFEKFLMENNGFWKKLIADSGTTIN